MAVIVIDVAVSVACEELPEKRAASRLAPLVAVVIDLQHRLHRPRAVGAGRQGHDSSSKSSGSPPKWLREAAESAPSTGPQAVLW